MSRRRTLWIWTGAVLLSTVTALAFFGTSIYTYFLQPGHDFGDRPLPLAPDYTDARFWAAWPGNASPAERLPPAVTAIPESERGADVFFLHPTTFGGTASWVAPVDDAQVNAGTDYGSISTQASAFNGCCRIYAPRFRQANILTYSDRQDSTFTQVMDVAYGDIAEAFKHFIATIGPDRPFLLASHSQGTFHLVRLLQQEVDGTPLVERLVAVYAIGHSLTRGLVDNGLSDIPLCEAPEQQACLISWDAHEADRNPSGLGNGEGDITWNGQGYTGFGAHQKLCVNPITWRTDAIKSAADEHLGAINWQPGPYTADVPLDGLYAGTVTAQCELGPISNWLWVNGDRDPILRTSFPWSLFGRNLHGVDYSLFWADIRENAMQRTDAWFAANRSL